MTGQCISYLYTSRKRTIG